MSTTIYSPLQPEPGRIRLLRLMPDENKAASVQCKLIDYTLQKSDECTHLYEALSYVWGDPKHTLPIFVDGHEFHVTENLHDALIRLRNHALERVLWIDAICINQGNNIEKGQQIPLMETIFGQASRVIVWLGEADDGDQALEAIRIAVDVDNELEMSETYKKAVSSLVHRSWFRRIWVLQEVAAARTHLIMYGAAQMYGFFFSSGLSQLDLSDIAQADLQGRIRSLASLMERASLRPEKASGSKTKLSLGELMDIYHAHEATIRHDKLYALLNMSKDAFDVDALAPDYTLSWGTVFERLIKFLLCDNISVMTWDDGERAVIKTKGYIFGMVELQPALSRGDQRLVVHSGSGIEHHWTLEASAKPIQDGDLTCFLEGASKPTIIRARYNYFIIAVIAVTPLENIARTSYETALEWRQNIRSDYSLVWNWAEGSEDKVSDSTERASAQNCGAARDYLRTLSKDPASTLANSRKVTKAAQKVRQLIEQAGGKESWYVIDDMERLGMNMKPRYAQILLSYTVMARKRLQGVLHPDTLNSIANLTSARIKQEKFLLEGDNLPSITDILGRIRRNDRIPENVMAIASRLSKSGIEILTVLFDSGKNVSIIEYVIRKAMTSEKPLKMLACLLEVGNVLVTEKMMKIVATTKHAMEAWPILLRHGGDKIPITEGILMAIVSNNQNEGAAIIRHLLEGTNDNRLITEEVFRESIWRGNEQILKTLFDRCPDMPITEQWMRVAASNALRFKARKITAMLLSRRTPAPIPGPVREAAKNNFKVWRELLEMYKEHEAKIGITEFKDLVSSYFDT